MSSLPDDIQVLHVDDEPNFADLVSEYLEKADDRLAVETATNASDALALICKHGYDCIVSDYDMPGRDGIEFLEAVRTDYPDLPFILYTGKGSEEVASEAISANVTDYLQKGGGTSQYEVLANRIRNAVDTFHTRRELDRTQDILEHTQKLADIGGWEADLETGDQRWTRGTYAIHDLEPESGFDPTLPEGLEFYHHDDQDEIERLIERSIETGDPYEAEFRLRTADDRLRWVRVYGEPIREDEEIRMLRGAIQDVTERREREQELQRIQRRHRSLLDNTNDAIARVEHEGKTPIIRTANPVFEDLFQPPDGDVIGRDIDEVVATGERIEDARDISRRVQTGESLVAELRRDTVDGTRDFLWQAVPFKDPGTGGFDEGFSIYTDITEQRERERTITQLVQRIDTLIHTTEKAETADVAVEIAADVLDARLVGVHLLSEDGERLEAVATMDEVREEFEVPPTYGRSEEQTTSELVWKAFERDELMYIADTHEYGSLAEETPARSVVILPLADHGVFILSTTEPDEFDDTDRNFIELAGQTLTAVLDRVDQTAELERKRDRLEMFASMISHDLRNPLNVAEGRLELATEKCDSAHLDAVEQAHTRMETLIEDTLSLAKAGETIGDIEPVTLPDLLDTCWQQVDTGTATLIIDTEAAIAGHSSRLQELFENLFRNAVEHGGSEVVITVGDLCDGFYVADDGSGISDEKRETILDTGYSSPDQQGGLGLSIVREIAEAHGWEVNLSESEAGGARFEFVEVDIIES